MLLFTVTAIAQDKQSLQQKAREMYEVTVNNDYDKILDYTYPKIFELVPREQMKEILSSLFNSPELEVTILDTPPEFTYGDIKKINDGYYCLVQHNLSMKMVFAEKIAVDQQAVLVQGMKKAMATDKVTFDEKENAITIHKRAEMIAVSDSYTVNKWSFANNNKEQGNFMNMLFSEAVINELGL